MTGIPFHTMSSPEVNEFLPVLRDLAFLKRHTDDPISPGRFGARSTTKNTRGFSVTSKILTSATGGSGLSTGLVTGENYLVHIPILNSVSFHPARFPNDNRNMYSSYKPELNTYHFGCVYVSQANRVTSAQNHCLRVTAISRHSTLLLITTLTTDTHHSHNIELWCIKTIVIILNIINIHN